MLQAKGVRLLSMFGDPAADEVWLVEGTKQSLAAAAYKPPGVLVVGIPGCRNAMSDRRLLPALAELIEDKRVIVLFDADIATNPDVHAAATQLKAALEADGADEVKFASVPGESKTGLDDYLGGRVDAKRPKALSRLVARTQAALPARPRRRAADLSSRPAIDVTMDRHILINEVSGLLRDRWDGDRLFNHGGQLSERDGAVMKPLLGGRLRDLLAEAAFFCRPTKMGDVAAWPDANTISAVESRAPDFTPLDRIMQTPFVRMDGTICQAPGYDPHSRAYLIVGGDLVEMVVPEAPTTAQVEAAVALILGDWLGDFPVAVQADQANLLALVLTPFIRGLVPLAPLALINGLQMGVGKNLLADCLSLLVTGSNAEPLPFPSDDDEARKVITSTFATGKPMFVFDEAHSVQGRSLARALTAVTYTDRILGFSRMAEYPNQVTWIALGNQIAVQGDLARRVYKISLWPRGAAPENRDTDSFRHPDLRTWTREHRGQLVTAVLTLVRAWFAAGQPVSPRGVSFGSFEGWDRVCGGILHVAGVEDFLADTGAWRQEADFDTAYWTEHLAALWKIFRNGAFTSAEVAQLAEAPMAGKPDFPAPPGLEMTGGQGYTRKLGQSYATIKDRWFGDYRLHRVGRPGAGGAHGSVNKWQVERRGDSPGPAGPRGRGAAGGNGGNGGNGNRAPHVRQRRADDEHGSNGRRAPGRR